MAQKRAAEAEAFRQTSLAEPEARATVARADARVAGRTDGSGGQAGANLTVLNGTQGVNEVLAGLVGQGLSILDLLRKPAPSGSGPAQVQAADGGTPANGSSGVADLN